MPVLLRKDRSAPVQRITLSQLVVTVVYALWLLAGMYAMVIANLSPH